jgi:ABC-type nitrate/sulfonate/bicarbonate transport system permease component
MELTTNEQIIDELGLRRQRRWSIYDHPNLIRVASVTVFLLLWQYFGRKTNPILFTYPSAIAVAFVKLVASGELIKQMAVSLSALAVGFFVSLVLGVALGLVLGMSRTAEAFFEPLINALYATPQVALTPLLMMWLGLGFSVKVSVVFLFAFFPILINTASGAKNVSAAMIEVARAYLAPRRKIRCRSSWPACASRWAARLSV